MSELGLTLLVLAAQVTLPLIGGLLLSRRRDPAAACVPLVVATVAVIVLTPLAFIPRSEWRTNDSRAIESPRSLNAAVDATTATANAPAQGIDLLELLKLMPPAAKAEEPAGFNYWRATALVVIGLAALGLSRFCVNSLAIFSIVRRATPVNDPAMLAIVEELRVLTGSRRPIALRESDRVGSAATAGWLRPVILLAPTWNQWTSAECRAVLAHEMAHIARGDFLARLLARFAVALHGYHPLARWLNSQLELCQEMAADAIAARMCGSRSDYLKSIASIAIKADTRTFGLAPTFLSRRRNLLRRIAMLRVMDDRSSRPRRWPALVVIGLMAVAALGLHGTTSPAKAGPIVPARFLEKDRAPLDASFILPTNNADEVGVFAIRIGELCRTPGMENLAESVSSSLPMMLGNKKVNFTIKDVEQIAGRVSLTHDPKKPAPNRSLSLSATFVRMEKSFDWNKQLREWGTDWKEHSHQKTKYYSVKAIVPILGLKDVTVWYYLPDDRSIVLESEANIKKLIETKAKRTVTHWLEDWDAVSGGMFALVLPDVKGKLSKKLPSEKVESDLAASMLKPIKAICSKVNRAAIGANVAGGLTIKARFVCDSGEDAADVDAGCQAVVKLVQAALGDDSDEPADATDKAVKKMSIQLVRGVEFGRSVDHIVEVRMSSKTGFADLLKAFDPGVGAK